MGNTRIRNRIDIFSFLRNKYVEIKRRNRIKKKQYPPKGELKKPDIINKGDGRIIQISL